MSLVEAMIFLGLFSIGVLTTLQWLQSVYQRTNMIHKNSSIDNAMTEVAIAFGTDDKYCNYILSSWPGNPNPDPHITLNTAAVDGVDIGKIDFHDENGNVLGNVLTTGNPFNLKQNDLVVKSMRLKPIASTGPQKIIAKIEFAFQRGTGVTSSETKRWMPIAATVDPVTNYVTNCSIAGDSLMTLRYRQCEIESDGFEHYEVNTDTCVLNSNVKWYRDPSDPAKIRCPAGTRPAVSVYDFSPELKACNSKGSGGVTLKSRTYQSGRIDNSPSEINFVPSFDRVTGACSFAYVAQVNPSNFVPEIKCVGAP